MLGREPGHPSPKAPSLSAAAGPKEESSLTSEARMEALRTPVFPGAEPDSDEQLLRPPGGVPRRGVLDKERWERGTWSPSSATLPGSASLPGSPLQSWTLLSGPSCKPLQSHLSFRP